MIILAILTTADGSRVALAVWGRNRITCGDTLTGIAKLPDASVNLIIADIPYYGIVEDDWDNQWASEGEYLAWLDVLFGQFAGLDG